MVAKISFMNFVKSIALRYFVIKVPVPELRRMLLENRWKKREDLFGGKDPSHRDLWGSLASE